MWCLRRNRQLKLRLHIMEDGGIEAPVSLSGLVLELKGHLLRQETLYTCTLLSFCHIPVFLFGSAGKLPKMKNKQTNIQKTKKTSRKEL
jgi:hypothetical protein